MKKFLRNHSEALVMLLLGAFAVGVLAVRADETIKSNTARLDAVIEDVNLRTPETPLKKLQETIWLKASEYETRLDDLEDLMSDLEREVSTFEGADNVDDTAIRTEFNLVTNALSDRLDREIRILTDRVDKISSVVQRAIRLEAQ